jgi:hypothetical protein
MSDKTAAEIAEENRRAQLSRSERELESLESTEQGTSTEKAPKKAAPKEKRGTGRDDSKANFERLAKGLRAKIAVARGAGNTELASRLESRLAELRKTIQ